MPKLLSKALATSAAALIAWPALAFDPAAMTEPERQAFRAEIRAYLLENPEVLMEAIQVLEQRQAEAQSAGEAEMLAAAEDALLNDPDSWVGGNPEGDVTVVEFLDYRCGYCRKAHPEVAELIESDGNIRIIVKEFPILGEASTTASRFAIATRRVSGDDAYKTVSDALMTMRGDYDEASLRKLAEQSDLPADEIIAEMAAPEVDQIISRNRQLGQALQINGTPSFVFGDQMIRGYVPLDAMREIVAQERAEG